MNGKPFVWGAACVVLLAVVATWFFWPSSKPHLIVVTSPRDLAVPKLKVAESAASTGVNSKAPRLYSPLTDPLPVDTPESRQEYNKLLWGWLTPNVNGAPLAANYDSVAKKAEQGHADSALALYRDLRFCRARVPQSTDLEGTYTESDLDDHRNKDLAFDQAAYKYCANLSSAQRYQEDHWLWLAAKGGNLNAQAMVEADTLISKNKQRQAQKDAWLENAAQHGNLDALSNMTTVAYFTQHSRVKMYAYYAIIYLQTQSPTAAGPLHYESQFLSPFQIQQAEELARKMYAEIVASRKSEDTN